MNLRKYHRAIGIILTLPLLAWSVTGLIFFIKPGYQDAYEVLQPKTYPMEAPVSLVPDPSWMEFRCFKTILGRHLIVRTSGGWQHLDIETHDVKQEPRNDEIRLLLNDAFSQNIGRYGEITEVAGRTAVTNTGVRATLDWDRLRIQQRGTDTDLIDNLYRIHYLQWTGDESVDKVLGIAGIVLTVLLSVLGLMLAFGRNL